MDEPDLYRYIKESFTNGKKFLKAAVSALLVVSSYLFSTIGLLRDLLPERIREFITLHPQLVPPALNLVIISVLIFWLGKGPFIDNQRYPDASRATPRFYWSWLCAWITWFAFYVYMFLEEWLLISWRTFNDPWIWSAVQNALNNLQTGFLLLCYFFLTWQIAAAVKKQDFQARVIILPLLSVVVLLAAVECILAELTSGLYADYAYYFETLSAFAGGVAVCLVASRLGSQFVGRVTIAVSIVYLYALIQPAYTTFRAHPQIKIMVLTAALPLKIWLFILVRWLMTRGGLLFYFHESINLHAQIQSDRENFKNQIVTARAS